MKLRFTRRAIENIVDAADFLRERNPPAALRLREEIYDSLQRLLLFPEIGRRQEAKDVRKVVTRKFRYIVYYAINWSNAEVVILNVKHPAQEREHDDI